MASSKKKAAKAYLEQLKYEIAKENDIALKQGYNGDLTTKDNGTIGGNMVKKMIDEYKQNNKGGQ